MHIYITANLSYKHIKFLKSFIYMNIHVYIKDSVRALKFVYLHLFVKYVHPVVNMSSSNHRVPYKQLKELERVP